MRAIVIGALAVASLAGSGKLDSTFGSHGKVVTAIDDGATAQGIALQRDGKLVVAGFVTKYGSSSDFEVARYTPRGRLDRHFGQGGKVATDFGASDYATAVKIQRGGKIVVAGYVVGATPQLAVARYRPNGSLDSSFGAGGKVLLPGIGLALALQLDGKIVVGGQDDSNFALYRLKRDGSRDPAFGTDGEATTQFEAGSASARGLTIQPNGKIVAVGSAVAHEFTAWALARYNRNGSLDTTFGSGGKVTALGNVLSDNEGEAVVLQGKRRILAAGTRNGLFALAGFRPNGKLDASFGLDRGVSTAFGSTGAGSVARALAKQRNGTIVAAGEAFRGGNWKFALARFNRNGMTLTAATTPLTDGHDAAQGLVVQPDGKLVAAGIADEDGYSGGMIALVRYRR